MPRGRSGREKERCPRCGAPVSYFEEHRRGGRVYVVAVHYEGYNKETRKKRVRKCYLGPKGGYAYVTQTHEREGLVLKGMRDRDRVLEYLDAIIHYLETLEYEGEEEVRRLAEIGDALIRLGKTLKEGIKWAGNNTLNR